MSDRLQFAGKIVLGVVLMGAAYCAGCGRVDAWPGWCFSGFFLMMLTASHVVLVRVAPDLVVERVSWPADAMRWDKQIVSWLAIAPIVTCLVAGLDARRNGVPAVSGRVLIGYGVAIVAAALIHSAMAVNRFYAPTVRIQVERGTSWLTRSLQASPSPGQLGEYPIEFSDSVDARLSVGLGSGRSQCFADDDSNHAGRSYAQRTTDWLSSI